jgi:hypothetical protein
MLQVFHNDKFLEYYTDKETLLTATIRRVAFVETSDPQEAYRLTNNIDQSWTENPGVDTAIPNPRIRSTSVGDVIVEGSAGDPGSKHLVVEPCGFRELTREEICSLTYCI